MENNVECGHDHDKGACTSKSFTSYHCNNSCPKDFLVNTIPESYPTETGSIVVQRASPLAQDNTASLLGKAHPHKAISFGV